MGETGTNCLTAWRPVIREHHQLNCRALNMIRVTILLILFTRVSVSGQDSTLVRQVCNTFDQISDSNTIEQGVLKSFDIIRSYLERHPLTGDNPLQEGSRFQYRLARELIRSCPNYPSERARMVPNPVFDLENKLTIVQIDSLSVLIEEINKKNDVYLYIVTIDSFYPDSTIVDFSNRYREFWAPQETPQKGIILMIFSTTQRQVRISTGDVSMTYLTDIECDDVIRGMTPYFKKGKYLEGLTNGLLAIEIRL